MFRDLCDRAYEWQELAMHFLILLFLLCTSLTKAQKLPLLTQGSLSSSADVLNRIQFDAFDSIRKKYAELQSNYVPHFLTTGLDFDCRSSGRPADENAHFAGIRVSQSQKNLDSGLVQTFSIISHFDCKGHLIFAERIKVIAKKAVLLSIESAVKFERFFEVLPGETARIYEIEDRNSNLLFSLNSQRSAFNQGQRIYTYSEFLSQRWLVLDQLDPSENERRLSIQVHPLQFVIDQNTTNISFGNNGAFEMRLFWTEKKLEHRLGQAVSNQITFENQISNLPVRVTTNLLNQILSQFIKQMPVTTQFQSGLSDSEFLRELQLNLNQLSSGDTSQVKLFLQKTIEKIKSGSLKVEQ